MALQFKVQSQSVWYDIIGLHHHAQKKRVHTVFTLYLVLKLESASNSVSRRELWCDRNRLWQMSLWKARHAKMRWHLTMSILGNSWDSSVLNEVSTVWQMFTQEESLSHYVFIAQIHLLALQPRMVQVCPVCKSTLLLPVSVTAPICVFVLLCVILVSLATNSGEGGCNILSISRCWINLFFRWSFFCVLSSLSATGQPLSKSSMLTHMYHCVSLCVRLDLSLFVLVH